MNSALKEEFLDLETRIEASLIALLEHAPNAAGLRFALPPILVEFATRQHGQRYAKYLHWQPLADYSPLATWDVTDGIATLPVGELSLDNKARLESHLRNNLHWFWGYDKHHLIPSLP